MPECSAARTVPGTPADAMPTPPLARRSLESRVSVVLLTYNCAQRLDPILDHLLDLQVEIIAVDNGSRDDTVSVLHRRGLRVLALAENIGAAARNLGVEHATTPYVAMCDDDGWYERDGLIEAADLLDHHPRLAVVNGRILVGDEERLDPISAEMAVSPLPATDDLPGAALLGFMAGAVVVRRRAYPEEPRLVARRRHGSSRPAMGAASAFADESRTRCSAQSARSSAIRRTTADSHPSRLATTSHLYATSSDTKQTPHSGTRRATPPRGQQRPAACQQ